MVTAIPSMIMLICLVLQPSNLLQISIKIRCSTISLRSTVPWGNAFPKISCPFASVYPQGSKVFLSL
ncbi:unnamed protein product [Tuber melanosporum]|uniref:(Perigord truffle) hypothetical protein n=1 Tax=Tuber melanosporum (strain Mel28) TaxID=656061 RepID=D5GMJ4_TUBMM|nr:uncharacterized protein GSTUM_00010753001 [Tuber melanosporum]CAZ85737.1 unnamed protein product [Tuber melanosporum]